MIPVYQPLLGGNEKTYVNQCLDSTWISSKGEFIDRFEKGFAAFMGVPHATSVCNGTVALHVALLALGLGPGDEVIVPTLTYVASVNAILQTGAKAVFAESAAGGWNLDPGDVRRRITPRTRAVMAVHLYGLPCAMDALVELCRDHNLLLVEDCAEAIGSRYRGRHVGTFGDVATFSFFGNKTITCGEGGMVVAGQRSVIDRVHHLKTQGLSPGREYWHDVQGYNYRMTNICAAIGLAQLEQVESFLERKRAIAAWYREGCESLPVSFQEDSPDAVNSYWMCSFLVGTARWRDPLRRFLRDRGIDTRPLFHPAHQLPHLATGQSFPVAEQLSQRGINLPSYPALTRDQVFMICDAIRKFHLVQAAGDMQEAAGSARNYR
ncbi:MAG: DegT/DnrJ/EryC1/StrS aminotransferase family protein [Pseudomonadota bacterium]